ncbi:MAG: FAD-dependent oxidoreductase [Candidatus Kapaibacterium sp.]|nr:MAG: FAD-dependent oxidoreductase [Candidatus Kapabacteria bacterium]
MLDVCIIGAGVAGLACAAELAKRGIDYVILESTGRVGGRVATDHLDGFLLDRGFQILLSEYPEAKRVLDYGALNLRAFDAGAKIWLGDRFTTIANPLKHPQNALETLFAPIGSFADKLRILTLQQTLTKMSFDAALQGRERTTAAYLREYGFSERMIERFFQPFFGGVFFDMKLQTSSRMFEFLFRMFALGQATLPAAGMEQIPLQMTSRLDASKVRLNSPVNYLEETSNDEASGMNKGMNVVLNSGETVQARHVVIASDWQTAAKLSKEAVSAPKSCGTTTVYFAAKEPPVQAQMLVLNGTGRGLVNNMCVPNLVAPLYAPDGEFLISTSIIGIPKTDDETLLNAVRQECQNVFGKHVQDWRHLRTYRIEHALPSQEPPALSPTERPVQLSPRLFVAGDHRDTASIHGAMVSGRRVAEGIAAL